MLAIALVALPPILAAVAALDPVVPRTLRATGSDRMAEACGSPNPFLATTRFVDGVRGTDLADRPVVFAFRDTPDDASGDRIPLATYGQVGTVYGLAFDAASGRLFAAAYLKRGSLFPPAGAGAIYRLDPASGAVAPWASLPAGDSGVHRLRADDDASAAAWVGRMSLGDIDIDPAAGVLLAANLFDGRIYRLALADGAVLGSFAHGASAHAWGKDARPFGLAVRDGWLYHGVVDPAGASPGIAAPMGHIYRSRPDGADLSEVAAFPLDPQGEAAPFSPWWEADQPVVADLELLPDGALAVAIRNLALDATIADGPMRFGDLLRADPAGDRWQVVHVPEPFDDTLA
ncbi:MAG: hypothetical protein DYG90_14695, partial [Chloroflexi bacterium CFX6]|nr:hypothetical protein [Chloroflexi bacterium CFX6]